MENLKPFMLHGFTKLAFSKFNVLIITKVTQNPAVPQGFSNYIHCVVILIFDLNL